MTRYAIAEKVDERQFLVFTLQGEKMGFPVACVREVIKPQEIHVLVQAPAFVKGVIYVRRCVLVVVSLRKRFGFKENEDERKERIIICKVNAMIIGLLVDSVSEVLTVPAKSIQQPSDILALQNKGRYVTGLVRAGEDMITLLDLEQLVTKEELASLAVVKP